MTTLTANLTTNSGRMQSQNASYATAQAGSSLSLSGPSSPYALFAGQTVAGGNYTIYESFAEFDTSAISISATISSVTLQFNPNFDSSTTDFTLDVFAVDYGSLTTADWQPPAATFGAATLLATLSTSGWTLNTYNAFTLNGSNLANAIVKGGATRLVLVSSRSVANTAPSGNEYAGNNANSSSCLQLIVTYQPAARVISPTVGLKATNTRAVAPTAALKATNVRTITPSAGLKATLARAITSSALLQAVRTIASSVLLSGSLVRQITPSLLLTYHTLTPLHGATITDGATSATGMAASDAVTSDDATDASLSGAVHAVMIGAGGTKARFS